jgi:hypothetical protein
VPGATGCPLSVSSFTRAATCAGARCSSRTGVHGERTCAAARHGALCRRHALPALALVEYFGESWTRGECGRATGA